VSTDRGDWTSVNVVVATGYHTRPVVPRLAASLTPDVVQLNPATYRRPDLLPAGGVLVVGASASGVQITDELAEAGRDVVLAVGAHTSLPRDYRGRDILWWLDRIGALDRSIDEAADPATARREPSLQLAGSTRPVNLGALQRRGARLAGRLAEVRGAQVGFADDLPVTVGAAQDRLRRVLADIDEYADSGRAGPVPPRDPVPDVAHRPGPSGLDLHTAGISTVVWATGFRPAYPWLAVPVLDQTGRIRHHRGVTAAAGLYAIGLRFQHRRNSTFIDGARHDAAYLANHIAARSTAEHPPAAPSHSART
jgi:putative flavoprotein involved in K+ transport